MTDTGGIVPSEEEEPEYSSSNLLKKKKTEADIKSQLPLLSEGGLCDESSSRRLPKKCFSGSSTVEPRPAIARASVIADGSKNNRAVEEKQQKAMSQKREKSAHSIARGGP